MVLLKKHGWSLLGIMTAVLFAGCSEPRNPAQLSPSLSTTSITIVCTQVENFYYPDNNAFLYIFDQNQAPVRDFMNGNFSITEDGIPDIVTLVKPADNTAQPLSVCIVMDHCGNMGAGPLSPMQNAIDTADLFVSTLSSNDQAEVIIYNGTFSVLVPFTKDMKTLKSALDTVTSDSTTAMLDAVVKGGEELAKQKGRKFLVVISGGYSDSSKISLSDCIAETNSKGISVLCVGVGSAPNMVLMNGLVSGTGGWVSQTNTGSITATFNQILYLINNQVELDFRSRVGAISKNNNRVLKVYLTYGGFKTSASKTYGF